MFHPNDTFVKWNLERFLHIVTYMVTVFTVAIDR